jgi:glycosyltransferase involved in cell wall biosynthesis
MRIGIDVSVLTNLKTGVENYTLKLIEGLSRIDSLNHYILFSHTRDVGFRPPSNFTVETGTFPTSRAFWRQIVLPSLASRHKVEVFHSPIMAFPIRGSFRRVVTIYDLSWIKVAGLRDAATYLQYKFWLKRIFALADRIITVSQSTKNDILRILSDENPDRIHVVHGAAGEEFKVIDDNKKTDIIKSKYRIDAPVILTVSLMRRRKNLQRLISAFSILKKKHGMDMKLLIVGKKTSMYRNLLKQCCEMGLRDNVVFTGHVPTTEIVYIYNAASLFVYPSLYEGFGIPVLEAMACGIPVIASNISALPEVVGDAGILVNPYDIEELACVMSKILDDEKLKRTLIEKGLKRARMFSWEKTARETLATYHKIAEK